MTALTQDRKTPFDGERNTIEIPVYAGEVIYLGALVVIGSDGYARAGAIGAGNLLAGVSDGDHRNGNSTVDNTNGSSGDLYVRVTRRGVFEFVCSGLTIADVGKEVFIVDDQTVSLTPGATPVPAGILCDFESATEAVVDITPATRAVGDTPEQLFILPFTFIGAVGAVGVKAFEDLELPRPYLPLAGFADAQTAPGSGYQCDITLTDGTTSFVVVIDDTATHGENKVAGTTPMLADTDTDCDLVDDNASGATADVKGYFVCRWL
jgi:hypothetical protein